MPPHSVAPMAPRTVVSAWIRVRHASVFASLAVLVTVAAAVHADAAHAKKPHAKPSHAKTSHARPTHARRSRATAPHANTAKSTAGLAHLAVALADTALPLTLLETTDIHGALLEGAKDRNGDRAWGSAPVLVAWERMIERRAHGAAVLLDGGDMMQGSPVSTLTRGRSVIDVMNEARYDAAACGNHEFDWTIDTLTARIHQATFPVLACNIFDKATNARPSWIKPYTLVRRGRVTVGIVGAATPDTPLVTVPKNVASLRFEDPVALINAYADTCRAHGADVVVALMHIGGESFREGSAPIGPIYEMAPRLHVDVLFGGHTHQFISTTIAGKPVMVAASHGRALAELDLTVNRVAHAVRVTSQVLHRTYADSVHVSPTDKVKAIVDRYNATVAPVMARVLGATSGAYLREEPSMGNFVADVMKTAAGTQLAFTNSGGLRADLDSGTVTLGEIYEIMPFDNALVTCTLTGAQVKHVLDEQPTKIFFAGMRATYDDARPAGVRAIHLILDDGTPIDSVASYTVVTNDFMWQGGDGFTTFAQGANVVQTGKLIRDAMVNFVTAAGKVKTPIRPDRSSRFTGRPARPAR